MSRTLRVLTASLVVALTLGSAGCGGDEPPAESKPTATPSPSPTLDMVVCRRSDSQKVMIHQWPNKKIYSLNMAACDAADRRTKRLNDRLNSQDQAVTNRYRQAMEAYLKGVVDDDQRVRLITERACQLANDSNEETLRKLWVLENLYKKYYSNPDGLLTGYDDSLFGNKETGKAGSLNRKCPERGSEG